MTKAKNILEIKKALDEIEEHGEEWITNFLVDDKELKRWIEKEQISYEVTQTEVIILRQRLDCQRMYFTTTNANNLSETLCRTLNSSKIITSILDRGDNASQPLKDILLSAGFNHYKTLKRVEKINDKAENKIPKVEFADMKDLKQIEQAIRLDFDNLLDNQPDQDEIEEAIKEKRIMIVRDNDSGEVAAFNSFEAKGKTVFGRYLCSMRKFRKQLPYGGIIFKQFVSYFSNATRILGWIAEDNIPSIKIHLACGFNFNGITEEYFKLN